MNKLTFYLFFITLGTVCVEVLSTNSIKALWNPIGYLVYGLLYIFFIDYIFRKKISDWKTIYLFGMLVGFITEAYFAKVVFFGWPNNNLIFHGFAIKEILILIFFIHPVFAFLLPVFVAKNFFNFPFQINKSKFPKLIFLLPLYPLLWSVTKNLQLSPIFIKQSLITLLIFTGITLVFYYFGKTKNILLSKKLKIALFLVFLIFYTLSFFKVHIYGRDYAATPTIGPLLISFVFVAFIFLLIFLRTRKLETTKHLEYKGAHNLTKVLAYLVYFYIAVIFLLFIATGFKNYLTLILTGIILLGTFSGVLFFFYILFDTVKTSLPVFRDTERENN